MNPRLRSRFLTALLTLALSLAPLTLSAALDLETATIADLQGAMKAGTLTSEKLVQAYLARIAAYDKQGPTINAVITANPKALEEAKALDGERKPKGRAHLSTASRSCSKTTSTPLICRRQRPRSC